MGGVLRTRFAAAFLPLLALSLIGQSYASDDSTDLKDAVGHALVQVDHIRFPTETKRPAALPVAFPASPMSRLAMKACSGARVNTSVLVSAITMPLPLRVFSDKNPAATISIADSECPEPLENATFVMGHALRQGEAVFYKTSFRGEIIQAVRMIGTPTGVRFEPISRITAEIQQDFDELKSALIRRYCEGLQPL